MFLFGFPIFVILVFGTSFILGSWFLLAIVFFLVVFNGGLLIFGGSFVSWRLLFLGLGACCFWWLLVVFFPITVLLLFFFSSLFWGFVSLGPCALRVFCFLLVVFVGGFVGVLLMCLIGLSFLRF